MRDFIRGWRRKAGCAALVMACGLTALWIHSRTTRSETVVPVGSRLNVLYGFEGHIYWVGYDAGNGMPLRWGYRTGYRSRDWLEQFSLRDFELIWPELEKKHPYRMRYWSFQPGHFAIPLTLLSAVLLLWPQRKRAKDEEVSCGGEIELITMDEIVVQIKYE